MIDRRNLQPVYPFGRLNRLLDGVAPGDPKIDVEGHPRGAPVLLHIGEPRNQPPDFVTEELTKAAAGWARYPLPRGTPEYRQACTDWLRRRYGLPADMIDPDRNILPLPGSREGLFFVAQVTVPAEGPKAPGSQGPGGAGRPVILIPSPCYHVYYGATAAAAAEPVFVPATRETGFQPDYAALPAQVLDRTALAYYCTPSNPQGAAAGLDTMQELIGLARTHDFTLAFDECYTEIYTGDPPPGALQAAAALGSGLNNLLSFQSLSKRSSAPGLRCGFVAGDADKIAALDTILSIGGAGVPLPTLAAGTRLWREEEHVTANRDRYRTNFEIAERVLGNRYNYRKPDGGFFLWLDVGDGEEAALTLWREAGIRALPGAYMCQTTNDGTNPGAPYLRIALIYGAAFTEAALSRVVEVL